MSAVWCIDLGPVFTRAALAADGGEPRCIPLDGLRSVVLCAADGGLLAGGPAVAGGVLTPERLITDPRAALDRDAWCSVVLDDRIVRRPAVTVCAGLLGTAFRALSATGGEPPDRMVLTYPAGWDDLRRDALRTAASAAGLPPVDLIAEPVAALGVVPALPGNGVFLVVDVGAAGTVTVLRRDDGACEILASLANDCGGTAFDAALARLALADVAGSHPEPAARFACADDPPAPDGDWDPFRHELAQRVTIARESLSAETGRDSVCIEVGWPGGEAVATVRRTSLARAVAPLIADLVAAAATILERTGLTAPDAVVLVGGAATTPGLVAGLRTVGPVTMPAEPATAVVRGGARTPAGLAANTARTRAHPAGPMTPTPTGPAAATPTGTAAATPTGPAGDTTPTPTGPASDTTPTRTGRATTPTPTGPASDTTPTRTGRAADNTPTPVGPAGDGTRTPAWGAADGTLTPARGAASWLREGSAESMEEWAGGAMRLPGAVREVVVPRAGWAVVAVGGTAPVWCELGATPPAARRTLTPPGVLPRGAARGLTVVAAGAPNGSADPGRTMVTAAVGGMVASWHADGRWDGALLDAGEVVCQAVEIADGVVVVVRDDGRLDGWRAGALCWRQPVEPGSRLARAPGADAVLVAGPDGLRTIDAEGDVVAVHDGRAAGVVAASNGAVLTAYGNEVLILDGDGARLRPRWSRRTTGRVVRAALSPRGGLAAVVTDSGQVAVWTAEGDQVATPLLPADVTAVAVAPEDDLVVAGSSDGTLRWWLAHP